MKRKKLAVIGASYLQMPLVQKAQEMDIEVNCFAWRDGAVCAEVADHFYDISTRDEDVLIYPGVIIDKETYIGDNTIINLGSVISHNTSIGMSCFIGGNVSIAGFVNIGNNNFIGIGATIIDNTSICNNNIIGAGTLIIKNISMSGKYVGTPARRL